MNRCLPFLCVVTVLVSTPTSINAQDARRPNIVLIIADDLGYGDLATYGAPDIKTPNLDRLAGEGVRFTDFYANAPVCTPSRAALMTGRYQQRLRLERPLPSPTPDGLRPEGRSLPHLLKQAGYATALIGKWHLGAQPEFHPNRHGFDYFWGYLAGYIDWYTHTDGTGKHDLWENDRPAHHVGYFGHEVTKRAVNFIRQHSQGSFFVEVAYGAPHWPFQSPHRPSVSRDNAAYQRASDADAPTRKDYVELVEDVDAGVGQILDALGELKIARDTLVIFMSDNGGEWLSRNAPFFHRKDRLWEGGIRVPAIFRWPAVLPGGQVTPHIGITMDVTVTTLAAAGVNYTPLGLEGVNLMPVLTGAAPPAERTLFWRNVVPASNQRAVRRGDWKLLLDGGVEFLFNVRLDAGERNDVAASNAIVVRDLRDALRRWEESVDSEAKQRQVHSR